MTSLIPTKMEECFLVVGNAYGLKPLSYISLGVNSKKSQTFLGQNITVSENIIIEGITYFVT